VATDTYSTLDSAPIHSTIERLARRITERFPGSGLSQVAAELIRLAAKNQAVVEHLRRPLWWLRGAIVAGMTAFVALVLWAAMQFLQIAEGRVEGIADVLQGIDAAINELILLFLALYFLLSLETRVKRRGALKMLHRLRSVAHVVDMHQLTKDPEQVLHSVAATPSSPKRSLTRAELARYLEYCSEILALISKLAALHLQHLQDPVVLDAVNDIETLTSDLSRTVWQKITILDIAKQT